VSFASKYYVARHSRTHADAWWVEIPVEKVKSRRRDSLHIVLEKAPDSGDFLYLRVPVPYLSAQLPKLDIRANGRVSLFLSAEGGQFLRDRRGSGKVNFQQFLQA
jgi:hypothetical protein